MADRYRTVLDTGNDLLMRVVACLVVLALTAACSSVAPPVVVDATNTRAPYAGPMHLPIVSNNETAAVLDRSGAAGRALECDGKPYDGSAESSYYDGLAEVRSSAAKALAEWEGPNSVPEFIPHYGYRVERRDAGRVLFSWDVAGRTKVAVIATNDVTDYMHHTGWAIETWAQCDPAEFPAAMTDAMGLGVWHDGSGRRTAVAEVVSFPGQSWCDFDGTRTMSTNGHAWQHVYVYDAAHRITQYLTTAFTRPTAVPADAVDSGDRYEGRELWTSPHERVLYLVSVDDPHDIEAWPAVRRGVGCD